MPIDKAANIVNLMFTEEESTIQSPVTASVLNPHWFDFEDLMEQPTDDTHPNLKPTHPFYIASDIAGVLTHNLPTFTPNDLLNRKFVYDIKGEQYNATVVCKLIDRDPRTIKGYYVLFTFPPTFSFVFLSFFFFFFPRF